MDSIVVKGGAELRGEIPIAGAKNACLTLMPATLLTDEPLTLTNAPRLSDIKTMTLLLQSLGADLAKTEALEDHQPLTLALMNRLEREAAILWAPLVTTEKDSVRLPKEFRNKVLALPVRLELSDWGPLDTALERVGL